MGIILKENNIIYTKKKHEKFLGSSKYRFDVLKNQIHFKEKKISVPVIPERIISVDSDSDSYRILREDYYSGISNCDLLGRVLKEKEKRPKKTEYVLNKKKVREKCSAFFGLRQSRKFLAFYSISFPRHFPDDYAFKVLNTVLTRLRKGNGLKSYLWVAERQKNGTIHFHLLTNNFIYVRVFNYYMAKAIENQINKYDIDVNFDVNKYNGVDVRHVNNNRKALNIYLTKYVSKNLETFFRLPYHSSRDISELFTAESFVSCDCSDFFYIADALKHITTLVIENDWCAMEYLCQKQANGKYFNPPDEWYWLRDRCNSIIYNNHHAKVKLKVLSVQPD